MSEKDDGSGKVKEPSATYHRLHRPKRRRLAGKTLRELAELRAQLSKNATDGKDAVTLVREERDR